jgi:hypothetical protein
VAEVGVGTTPEAECGGGRRRRSLELRLWRALGRSKRMGGAVGSGRGRERRGDALADRR